MVTKGVAMNTGGLGVNESKESAVAQHGGPVFGPDFRDNMHALFRWRRDVRSFDPNPVDDDLIEKILDVACLAPSVGNSQPWRFVSVDDPANRPLVMDNFTRCNAAALAGYSGERARRYPPLNVPGLNAPPRPTPAFSHHPPHPATRP